MLPIIGVFIVCSCTSNPNTEYTESNVLLEIDSTKNLLIDYPPNYEDNDVNAVIEIPSGTLEKWELNKTTGQIERDSINGVPRTINYLGYPGNYGMIPQTLLSKEAGGDGDPLDIIVLGPPASRGSVIKCKVIGVLYLLDNGEQDDKLIALSTNSPFYSINSITELDEKQKGISEILKLWFTNYKGPEKMKSKGFGSRNEALKIVDKAIQEFINN